MIKTKLPHLIVILILLILAFGFLFSPVNRLNNWQIIQQKGYIIWVTRASPLTYYSSLDGPVGIEYSLLKSFAKEHNLELKVKFAQSNTELFAKLDTTQLDIAGANLSLTEFRQNKYNATIAYDETYTSVVSSYKISKIKSLNTLKSLNGKVINDSSYVDLANKLTNENDAKITSIDNVSLYELLLMVSTGQIDYTLADENIYAIYKSYIPLIRSGIRLTKSHKLVFLLPNKSDDSFKVHLDTFIQKFKDSNQLNKVKLEIVKTLPNFKATDTVQFLKYYASRWNNVKELVYKVAKEYDISPILLGAISYQESHWNANAVSPTLVKGLMMLTKNVALEENVEDRLDPYQSLSGGTRYLLKMKKKIPARINEPDKTYFALAAYNLGYGHLEKARVITQAGGKNPDLWNDVKQFLPQLNDLFEKRADGKTAVRYVENIKVYQNLLQWKEQQQ